MSAISATYSFLSTAGSLTNPILGGAPITFNGEIGIGEFVVMMHTDHTSHDKGADGVIMPSFIAGDDGGCQIVMQQTSILYQELLALFNLLKIQALAGNAEYWAASALSLRNTVTGIQHILTGVSFSKVPDTPYAPQGSRLTWMLMAADVQTFSA
jgi:structural protein KPP10_ORF10